LTPPGISPAIFTPTRILIHHSASDDTPVDNTRWIRAWHKGQGWIDLGYHATAEQIDGEYEILVGRRWDLYGAHSYSQNKIALGLCLIGNFSKAEPPRAQLVAAAKFVAFWMSLYNIPITEIYPHSKFDATECPGTLFPWDNFIELVRVASA
jgi:hypothetical protein